MKRGLLVAAAVVAVLPSSGAATTLVSGEARLRVSAGVGLVVRGRDFWPGERVRVTAVASRTVAKRVAAGDRGAFTIRFALAFDRCSSSLTVLAVGDRGSRARVKLPEVMCPPSL